MFPATQNGATDFAKRVDRIRHQSSTSQASQQTVFNAASMSYFEEDNGSVCAFSRPADKYDCYKEQGQWHCDQVGNVIARHHLSTGHYEPLWDS